MVYQEGGEAGRKDRGGRKVGEWTGRVERQGVKQHTEAGGRNGARTGAWAVTVLLTISLIAIFPPPAAAVSKWLAAPQRVSPEGAGRHTSLIVAARRLVVRGARCGASLRCGGKAGGVPWPYASLWVTCVRWCRAFPLALPRPAKDSQRLHTCSLSFSWLPMQQQQL